MTVRTAGVGICDPRTPASRMGRGLAVAALGMLVFLLAVAPAGAAPTWLAPAKLSAAGHNAEKPQVAVDAQGNATAVWERPNGTNIIVEAASRPAGSGAWQASVPLSSATAIMPMPQVAVDARGDAVAVWESYIAGEPFVEAATRTGFTGAWQAPVKLSSLGVIGLRPDLAVNARGDAVVVWQSDVGIVEAASRPAGGAWQTPAILTNSAENLHPAEVGIDASGEATAVWEGQVGAEVRIVAASKPAGGAWQTPVTLSAAGNNANEPRVAVNARGDAVAEWERPSGEELIEAATKPASSATWGGPAPLTKPETGKGEPGNQQVAIDGQGDIVAVWGRFNSTHETIEATEGHVSSSVWQAPVALSPPGANVEEHPAVAVNEQGNAVVVWERSNGANEIVEGASGLASSGSWQPAVALSAAGQSAREPQVALDPQGNAAAVWSRFDGTAYIAEAAGFDAAGPLLSSLAIPATGTVGQPLAFSVSPFDVWSALGATSWSFGDGTSQTGASVTHTYGAPGTYAVTVTSADVLGNVTSTSASVSITGVAKPLPSILVAPRITAARVSPARFRVSKRSTAISARAKAKPKAKVPQGTTFHFTLNEAAMLKLPFTHTVAGLRSGKGCLAPSAKLRRRHAKRCNRTLTVGTLTRANERQGAGNLPFSGRIGAKPLAPGKYEAVLTASAGGLASAAVTLSLTVVR
jgi:PKD domain